MESPSRLTRSSSGKLPSSPIKRPPSPDSDEPQTPTKKARKKVIPSSPATPLARPDLIGPVVDAPLEVHMKLSFDYDVAKRCLISVDQRFEPLMAKIPCKPFEGVPSINEPDSDSPNSIVNPFKSLVTSILGQQVSWLAARAITQKFIRIYYPELPEKYSSSSPPTVFPTPIQVYETPHATLRGAGLSNRKAEYIVGLAARFADGRLTAQKLVKMTDNEVKEALTDVRGLGPWTCEMFQIFTLRRPDVVSPGDLGLQKGLIRWFGYDNPTVLPAKLTKPVEEIPVTPPQTPDPSRDAAGQEQVPVVNPATPASIRKSELPDVLLTPVTPGRLPLADDEVLLSPYPKAPAFPASKTLTKERLRARLSKKIKGNNYVSAEEMIELIDSWRPYRSIGLYYLWALADGEDSAV